MPYINQNDKLELNHDQRSPKTPGELNYCITKLLLNYCHPELNYKDINDVLGAIEGAKMEFYRRVVVPYENYKLAQNGDVYPSI